MALNGRSLGGRRQQLKNYQSPLLCQLSGLPLDRPIVRSSVRKNGRTIERTKCLLRPEVRHLHSAGATIDAIKQRNCYRFRSFAGFILPAPPVERATSAACSAPSYRWRLRRRRRRHCHEPTNSLMQQLCLRRQSNHSAKQPFS